MKAKLVISPSQGGAGWNHGVEEEMPITIWSKINHFCRRVKVHFYGLWAFLLSISSYTSLSFFLHLYTSKKYLNFVSFRIQTEYKTCISDCEIQNTFSQFKIKSLYSELWNSKYNFTIENTIICFVLNYI